MALDRRDLLALIRREYRLEWDGLHGAAHWARVRYHGLALAKDTGANARVVEAFAFLHDARRHDDYTDIEHGERAAQLVLGLGARELGLGHEELQLLAHACREHSHGRTKGELTAQVCWDADRLDLGRVGIRPAEWLLCTPAARQPKRLAFAYAWSQGAPRRAA